MYSLIILHLTNVTKLSNLHYPASCLSYFLSHILVLSHSLIPISLPYNPHHCSTFPQFHFIILYCYVQERTDPSAIPLRWRQRPQRVIRLPLQTTNGHATANICPHNSSVLVPDGSVLYSSLGTCHHQWLYIVTADRLQKPRGSIERNVLSATIACNQLSAMNNEGSDDLTVPPHHAAHSIVLTKPVENTLPTKKLLVPTIASGHTSGHGHAW